MAVAVDVARALSGTHIPCKIEEVAGVGHGEAAVRQMGGLHGGAPYGGLRGVGPGGLHEGASRGASPSRRLKLVARNLGARVLGGAQVEVVSLKRRA